MKTRTIMMVKIYITESSHLLNTIIHYLKNEAHIRGVSVFRAISGFGETGSHTTAWLDLSLDLPLMIEFFDDKAKIEPVIAHFSDIIKQEHMIFWEANTNI